MPALIQSMIPIPSLNRANITLVQPPSRLLLNEFLINPSLDGLRLLLDSRLLILSGTAGVHRRGGNPRAVGDL
jgi:hypothetical protein